MKIEIKTALKDFHEVDITQARHYVKYLLREGLPNIRETADKVAYIETNRLRGITVEELLYSDKDTGKNLYKENKNMGRNGCEVVQLTREGKFVAIHDSLKAAAKALGAPISNISRACKKNHMTSKGYKWMYLDEYIKQGGKIE